MGGTAPQWQASEGRNREKRVAFLRRHCPGPLSLYQFFPHCICIAHFALCIIFLHDRQDAYPTGISVHSRRSAVSSSVLSVTPW
jgi:hypothetical protein